MNALQVHKTEKGYLILHATEAHHASLALRRMNGPTRKNELREVLERLGVTEAAMEAGLLEVKDKDVVVFPA